MFEVTRLVTGRAQVGPRGLGHQEATVRQEQGRGCVGAESGAGVRTGEGAWHLPGCEGMSDLAAAQAGA